MFLVQTGKQLISIVHVCALLFMSVLTTEEDWSACQQRVKLGEIGWEVHAFLQVCDGQAAQEKRMLRVLHSACLGYREFLKRAESGQCNQEEKDAFGVKDYSNAREANRATRWSHYTRMTPSRFKAIYGYAYDAVGVGANSNAPPSGTTDSDASDSVPGSQLMQFMPDGVSYVEVVVMHCYFAILFGFTDFHFFLVFCCHTCLCFT